MNNEMATMMRQAVTSARIFRSAQSPLHRDLAATARDWFRWLCARFGAKGLSILAALAVAAAGYANWGWLVAIGLAPIILSIVPCVAMCAGGVCIMPKYSALAANAALNENGIPAAESTANPRFKKRRVDASKTGSGLCNQPQQIRE